MRLLVASFLMILCICFSPSLKASDAEPSKTLVKANQEICVVTLGNRLLDLSKPENQDLRRIVAALKHDYVQSGSFDSAAQLVTVGVARAVVNNLIRPHIEAELGRLEQISSPQRLSAPETALATLPTEAARSPRMTIEEFSEFYKLERERLQASTLNWGWSSRVDSSEMLKQALFTGENKLIKRALTEAFRNQNFDEMTALAASIGDDSALLSLGRLCIARYIFFERNSHWLDEGLDAFLEIKGAEKSHANAILYDLLNLIISDEINSNHDKIQTFYDMSESSIKAGFQILLTTLKLDKRRNTGSDNSFAYIMHPTRDPIYINYLRKLSERVLREKLLIDPYGIVDAVVPLSDSTVQLEIADQFYRDAKAIIEEPGGVENDRALRLIHTRLMVAFGATLASGNYDRIVEFVERILSDKTIPHGRVSPFLVHGIILYTLSLELVAKLEARFVNADAVATSKKTGSISEDLKEFFERCRRYQKEYSDDRGPAEHFFYHPNYRHQEETVASLISQGSSVEPASSNQLGEQYLAKQAYWESFGEFTKAKNLEGLQRTYDGMMLNGRGIDAVYVARAMQAIRSNSTQALPEPAAPLQLPGAN